MTKSQIESFYDCTGCDDKGRTFWEVISQSDKWFERCHDHVQWLYPLLTKSAYNPNAPLLTDEIINSLKANPVIQDNIIMAFYRIMNFYGLYRKDQDTIDIFEPWFQNQTWISPGNHNFLRITRVITSLRLLGFPKHAEMFRKCVLKIADSHIEIIGETTKKFWTNA